MKWFIAISLMWRQAQAAPAPAPGPGKHFLIETEDEDKEATGYKGNVSLWWHDDMMTGSFPDDWPYGTVYVYLIWHIIASLHCGRQWVIVELSYMSIF